MLMGIIWNGVMVRNIFQYKLVMITIIKKLYRKPIFKNFTKLKKSTCNGIAYGNFVCLRSNFSPNGFRRR